MSDTFHLLAVGVGGQGVLSTVRLLGVAGLAAGLDVRVGQLHGLAQRGGSVEATLSIGPGKSAIVSGGEADLVLGLEPLEAVRALPRMNSDTVVVLNPASIVPYSLTVKGETGPTFESTTAAIDRVTSHVHVVDASSAAQRAGSLRSLNVAMLGVVAGLGLVPIPPEAIRDVVTNLGRAALRKANLEAFELGRELGIEAALEQASGK